MSASFLSIAQMGVYWQYCYGGSDGEEAYAMVRTHDNGFAILGWTSSTDGNVSQNYIFQDFWLVKLDSLGVLEWEHTYGGNSIDFGYDLAQTSDGGFIMIGETSSSDIDAVNNHGGTDFLVIKTDALGNKEWSRTYGGSNTDIGHAIIEVGNNNYIIAGSTRSSDGDISNSYGDNDGWLAKIDNMGNIVWETTVGTASYESIHSLIELPNGNFVTGGMGNCFAMISSLGAIQSVTSFPNASINDMKLLSDNTIAFVGWKSLPSLGTDFWVCKAHPNGSLIWEQTYGAEFDDTAMEVTQLSTGQLMVVGITESIYEWPTYNHIDVSVNYGRFDIWVTKLDQQDGSLLMEKSIGGTSWDYAYGVLEDYPSGYVIAGTTRSTDFYSNQTPVWGDWWILKIDEYSSIEELAVGKDRKIVGVFDLLGRPVEEITNQLLIYVYDDGSTEKVMRVD